MEKGTRKMKNDRTKCEVGDIINTNCKFNTFLNDNRYIQFKEIDIKEAFLICTVSHLNFTFRVKSLNFTSSFSLKLPYFVY